MNFQTIYKNRKSYIIAVSVLVALINFSILTFFIDLINPAKTYVFAFLATIPSKFLLSFLLTPRENEWQNQALRISFFGFGLSFAIYILSLLTMAFFFAVTGFGWSPISRIFTVFGIALGEYFALNYIFGEIRNFKLFGIDYLENMEIRTEKSDGQQLVTDKELAFHLTILNMDENYTEDGLNQRFKELATLYHPDRLNKMSESGQKVGTEEFKRIRTSYEYLKDKL